MWGHSLDDCAFGAPCSGEHDPGGEADSQVIFFQAQELGAVFQSLTGLVLQNAATWDQMQNLMVMFKLWLIMFLIMRLELSKCFNLLMLSKLLMTYFPVE